MENIKTFGRIKGNAHYKENVWDIELKPFKHNNREVRLRDKYIKERDALAREKDEAYSAAWVYIKDSNERFNNDYVSHKANINPKYKSLYQRYLKAVEKSNKFIAICRAYESRENILRTINANLRKG